MKNTQNPQKISPSERIPVDNILIQEFPVGFRSAPHLHSTYELLLCLSGSFRADVRGSSRVIHPGEYITAFREVPHSIQVLEPCRVVQLHFHRPRDMENWPELSEFVLTVLELRKNRFLVGTGSPQLRSCVEGMLEEFTRRDEEWEVMAGWYMQQLFLLLARDLKKQGRVWDGKCIYISRAVHYIGEHYREKLTVGGVAQSVGVSPRHLNRLFQEQLGLCVSGYLTDVRISSAVDFMVLHPDYPLSQLALDMGFSSQQHFSKVFREKMGTPPGKYFGRLRGEHN